MTHANAPFTPTGRERLARLIVEDGWPCRRAAERFPCSPATAAKWAARYQAGLSMRDRLSRPGTSPSRLNALAGKYRVDPKMVSAHLRSRGLRLGQLPLTASEIAISRELHAQGLSLNAIGRTLGRDPKTVKAAVAAHH